METIEYRNVVDKSSWPRGPWDDEPDKKQWRDPASGLPCLIVRGPSGSLCGYVAVGPDHPAYGKGYDDVDVTVHGGLTFAAPSQRIDQARWSTAVERYMKDEAEADRYPRGAAAERRRLIKPFLSDFDSWAKWQQGRSICCLSTSGESADVWWFGFDTAHSGDFCPKHAALLADTNVPMRFSGVDNEPPWPEDTYKTWSYVEREVCRLAQQLVAIDATG